MMGLKIKRDVFIALFLSVCFSSYANGSTFIKVEPFFFGEDSNHYPYIEYAFEESLKAELSSTEGVVVLNERFSTDPDVVLSGSIKDEGGYFLVDLNIRKMIKDERYNASIILKSANIFFLQDQFVAEVIDKLKFHRIIHGESKYMPEIYRSKSEAAYKVYLEGVAILNAYSDLGKLDEAADLFYKSISYDGDFQAPNAALCKLFILRYEDSQDLSYLAKAREYCTASLKSLNVGMEALVANGDLYGYLGEFEKALEFYKRVLALNSQHFFAKLGAVNVYQNIGKFDKSVALLDEMLESYPFEWKVYQMLGYVYFTKGDRESLLQSIQSYKLAIGLNSKNLSLHNNLGIAYTYLGDLESATNAFEAGLSTEPRSIELSNLATIVYLSGRFDKAEELYRAALKLNPSDYRLLSNLGDVLRVSGRSEVEYSYYYKKSISSANMVLGEDAYNYDALNFLGSSLIGLEDFDGAEKVIRKSIDIEPNNINVLYLSLRLAVKKEQEKQYYRKMNDLLNAGYAFSLITADPDLSKLRSHAVYNVKLAELFQN